MESEKQFAQRAEQDKKETINELLAKRKFIYSRFEKNENITSFHEKSIEPFIQSIQKAYGTRDKEGKLIENIPNSITEQEYTKYRLWHILIDGTDIPEAEYFDFPGEHSIQNFIEKAYEEKIKKTKAA